MSILAYVLCVLLVATATTATSNLTDLDELVTAQKLFDSTFAMAINETEENLLDAQEYVNVILSQMLFVVPLNETYFDGKTEVKFSQAPSAECYEFLQKRIETNFMAVFECLESPRGVISKKEKRAQLFLDRVRMRLREHRHFAAQCKSLNPDDSAEVLMCTRAVLKDITDISYRAIQKSWQLIDDVEEVAKSWIPKTGACVAQREGGSAMEDWAKVCEEK